MAYFLIDNFASGLDLRRASEMAPPGSLRELTNAFINEGGEIEKRKAFTKDAALTAYGQGANFKERITGPYPVPGYANTCFFRHRFDDLPATSDWTAGAGSIASYYETGAGIAKKRIWAQKSTVSLSNFGAMFHGAAFGEYGSKAQVLEQHVSTLVNAFTQSHVQVSFTNDEPTSETLVAANADRDYLAVLGTKGYLVDNDVLYASAVGDPTDMAGTGSGALQLSTQGTPIGKALSLAEYYGQLAVFGTRGAQFYGVDPDFDRTQYQRTVPTSLLAPRSVIGYGDGDLLFLSRTGIRSLRARDSSNLARLDDIGSPIDALLKAQIQYDADNAEPIFLPTSADTPISDFYTVGASVLDEGTGQLWMAVGDRMYVLARHPAAKVQAWSTFALPVPATENLPISTGPVKARWVADIAPLGDTVIFRNFADEVFIYGGPNGDAYDDSIATVVTPFADMGRPGDNKSFHGLDVVCNGDWRIEATTIASQDGDPIGWFPIAEIRGGTRRQVRIALDFQGVQVALRLTTTSSAPAKISQVGIFYTLGAEK